MREKRALFSSIEMHAWAFVSTDRENPGGASAFPSVRGVKAVKFARPFAKANPKKP
jgi:hypothetical protein